MENEQLRALVRRIFEVDGTEDELRAWQDEFSASVQHPGGLDLIYYPTYWGLEENPTPDDVIDAVVNWRPKVVAMRVLQCRVHPNKKTYCIELAVKNKMRTQVISETRRNEGDMCVVAFSGAQLKDGRTARGGRIDGLFSAGEILGTTNEHEGYEFV